MKVRKDFNLTMPSSSGTSWNSILCGGAQSGMLATAFEYFYGNNTAPVSIAVGSLDPTASTGLAQWNNFYGRLICLGSKIVVDILNIGSGASDDVSLITLVPTVGHNLATGPGGLVAFDAAGIDPGELPYAKRLVMKGAYSQGGGLTRIKNYCKIKKMLGVKDMEDVTPSGFVDTVGPFVPDISGTTWSTASGTGNNQQPNVLNSGVSPKGIYWNLIFQNMLQNSTVDATGGTTYSPSVTIRVQLTSYVMLTDRVPLQTT